MAGLGYKDFTAGAVLTAAQVDGYLMEQSVMNFAGTAARGSALASVLSAGQMAHIGGGTVTVYDGSAWQQVYPTTGGGAFKNLLFNGAMQVSQRGTSTASITAGGYFTADRYYQNTNSLGTWTQSVENDAPTGSGFRKSLKILCTTADASPAAGDFLILQQPLEGQDLQRIAKGTSSAQQLTLSFWVKSNVTGTYIAELNDGDNSRTVSASYAISASATWERKTITFPADTTGAFDNDNALSLTLNFWLGAGSTYTGGSPLQTTWGTATNTRATGQTNLAAATNNYWQVTGVQLETGSVATAFEFKSFGEDLAECQRYYYRATAPSLNSVLGVGWTVNTIAFRAVTIFPTTMRAAPTAVEVTGTAGDYEVAHASAVTTCNAVPTFVQASATVGNTNFNVASGLTIGNGGVGRSTGTAAYLGWSAEL